MSGHDHGHGHGHGHHHPGPGDVSSWAFGVAVVLNVGFVIIELAYGMLADSMALVADAAHNLGDVAGLLLAWVAAAVAVRAPTSRRTYGYRKASVLAALANATLLLVTVGAVAWEAVGRLWAPPSVEGGTVAVVALIGVAINGVSALMFVRASKHDVNVRGAFLHLVADAAVSLGVVVAGVLVLQTGWSWIDPVTSLLISVVILGSTWGLLRDSLDLAMDAVPPHVDAEAVRRYLEGIASVTEIHDFHVWSMGGSEVALTAHLVVDGSAESGALLRRVCGELEREHGIGHSTIQLEPVGVEHECSQAAPGRI